MIRSVLVLCALSLGQFWATSLRAAEEVVFKADFSSEDLAAEGWNIVGDWKVVTYECPEKTNPGPVVRFAARKPPGLLSHSFSPVRDPRKLALSLNYGWGWGDAGQAADSSSFMLLDDRGAGYLFRIHRCDANWAVQWGRVENRKVVGETTWAPSAIDARHPAVRDGGGLVPLTVTREQGGAWTLSSPSWNVGRGGSVTFNDATTSTFSQLVFVGTENFDEQVFDRIELTLPAVEPVPARSASDFLNSIGVVTTFPDRGQPLDKTVEMVKYCGFRWVRGGIEGVTESGPTTMKTYLDLHRETGVKFNWGLVSGGTDIPRLLSTGRQLADAGALLAFEGNNEPNNWGATYQGRKGGGSGTWLPVAHLQRDLYQAVKNDERLKSFPVWSLSEGGAQTDNVGLQFLTIPEGADTLMPAGTRYADFANVHNYIYHPASSRVEDNKTWNAADPTSACKVDGLYGNYGRTWAKHFSGYPEEELKTLPRVTTETGTTIGGEITEEIHGLNLLTIYLAQFARGWSHTAVYLLRDRGDEAGNQSFGFYTPDYQPRKAAHYLHSLTTILKDDHSPRHVRSLPYAIMPRTATIHDLLLQKNDGSLCLIVWNERVTGSDRVTMDFGSVQPHIIEYDLTGDPKPTGTASNAQSLTFDLNNHPLVFVLPAREE